MKYFTPSMWVALQGASGQESIHGQWELAFQQYRIQLAGLRERLTDEAYRFFDEADVHDGELLKFVVRDGSRPAPAASPEEYWETAMNHPVKAELAVLEARERFVWCLSFSGVRRTTVDFPGIEPLFHQQGAGFGDWGYDELAKYR